MVSAMRKMLYLDKKMAMIDALDTGQIFRHDE